MNVANDRSSSFLPEPKWLSNVYIAALMIFFILPLVWQGFNAVKLAIVIACYVCISISLALFKRTDNRKSPWFTFGTIFNSSAFAALWIRISMHERISDQLGFLLIALFFVSGMMLYWLGRLIGRYLIIQENGNA